MHSALAATSCNVAGSSDLYGLGIRVGIYLQWLATWFANAWELDSALGFLSANGIFLISTLITVVDSTRKQDITAVQVLPYIELCIRYFVVFPICGWRYTFQKKSLDAPPTSIISWFARCIIILCLFHTYQVWFWFTGVDQLNTTRCTMYIFFFSKVNALGWVRVYFKVSSVLFCIIVGLFLFFVFIYLLSILWDVLHRKKKETSRTSICHAFFFTMLIPMNQNSYLSFSLGKDPLLVQM